MDHRANFVIIRDGDAVGYHDQWAALGAIYLQRLILAQVSKRLPLLTVITVRPWLIAMTIMLLVRAGVPIN